MCTSVNLFRINVFIFYLISKIYPWPSNSQKGKGCTHLITLNVPWEKRGCLILEEQRVLCQLLTGWLNSWDLNEGEKEPTKGIFLQNMKHKDRKGGTLTMSPFCQWPSMQVANNLKLIGMNHFLIKRRDFHEKLFLTHPLVPSSLTTMTPSEKRKGQKEQLNI